ncbi:MAG: DUF3793 family protein [Clostridiales bacterium]|nr:DUF3793 family protein [Clostridiales bacterium]
MNLIKFYNSLAKVKPKESIERFLLFNSSLVIAGIKPSATVAIKKNKTNLYKNWIKYGSEFLNKSNLEFTILRESDRSLILLIFNRKILNKHIFQQENMSFLREIGYRENKNLDYYLSKLKMRYKQFNCPHELGIFLGIPLNDVIDFIQGSNKKCLGTGYWKVYNNYDKAIKIFKKYDEVRNKIIDDIMKGIPLDKIIRNINSYNLN